MNLEKFLHDISYNSKYSFLEEAKDADELATIANKRGIKLPAHDLAVFSCTYAYIDRQNLNGCTLPKEEVEAALDTLVGKAVDFDHMRQRVVGHWVDAKLDGDKIVAYGVFFKGNFQEDYTFIKDMMEKDVLAISFEAYGNREVTGQGSYNLRDIEFSGGALLIKTNPAFPGSEVMEMAKQEKILEFAKVMTPPKEYIHEGTYHDKKKKNKDMGRLYLDDIQAINNLLISVECPSCKEKSLGSIGMIDLEKQELRVECYACGAIVKVDLTPAVKLIKKGKTPTSSDVKANIEKKGEKDMENKDKASLNDNIKTNKQQFTVKCNDCGLVFESDVRGESTPCESCGGTTVTQGIPAHGVPEHVKEEEKAMKEKIEGLEKEITTMKEEATKKEEALQVKTTELEAATATIEELKKESEEAKIKIEDIEKAKVEEVTKAKEDAIKITERKLELTEEFSKDVDLLNDSEYELAKAKKELAEKDAEIAELKKGSNTDKTKDLTKGSADKELKDEIEIKAEKVKLFAFGKE